MWVENDRWWGTELDDDGFELGDAYEILVTLCGEEVSAFIQFDGVRRYEFPVLPRYIEVPSILRDDRLVESSVGVKY